MSGTTSTATYVDATGVHVPQFDAILTYLQSQFQAIYGFDIYLGNDSQDGQLIGVFAQAIADNNVAMAQVYNNYSPQTSQGVGLSNAVKINAMTRSIPTNSTADVLVSGTPGSEIFNGQARDALNQLWMLPAYVLIPPSTNILVGATAQFAGATQAQANTITIINTPTRGWQTITNPSAAVPGDPVETDAALRVRQGHSTMTPSTTVIDGLLGALLAIPAVLAATVYDNPTNATDARGIPAFNLSCVVEGGDPQAVAQAIFFKKTPGVPTYGSTSVNVVDVNGHTNVIKFYRPTVITLQAHITIQSLTGYLDTIGDALQAAVLAYLNDPAQVATMLYYTRLYGVAELPALDGGTTYYVTAITVGKNGGSLSAANIAIAFNEFVNSISTDVTLVVT